MPWILEGAFIKSNLAGISRYLTHGWRRSTATHPNSSPLPQEDGKVLWTGLGDLGGMICSCAFYHYILLLFEEIDRFCGLDQGTLAGSFAHVHLITTRHISSPFEHTQGGYGQVLWTDTGDLGGTICSCPFDLHVISKPTK